MTHTFETIDANLLHTLRGGQDAIAAKAQRLVSDADKIGSDAFLACFRTGGSYSKCDDLGKAITNLTKLGTIDALPKR